MADVNSQFIFSRFLEFWSLFFKKQANKQTNKQTNKIHNEGEKNQVDTKVHVKVIVVGQSISCSPAW